MSWWGAHSGAARSPHGAGKQKSEKGEQLPSQQPLQGTSDFLPLPHPPIKPSMTGHQASNTSSSRSELEQVTCGVGCTIISKAPGSSAELVSGLKTPLSIAPPTTVTRVYTHTSIHSSSVQLIVLVLFFGRILVLKICRNSFCLLVLP